VCVLVCRTNNIWQPSLTNRTTAVLFICCMFVDGAVLINRCV
jgi:hypothetical protein